MAVLLDRTARISGQLDRIEAKVDRNVCKVPSKSTDAWFRDPKSIVGWIILALLLTGHVTLDEIKGWLMR